MMTSNFQQIMSELQNITENYKEALSFDTTLQTIIYVPDDPKKRGRLYDEDKLKGRILIFLIFFTMALISGYTSDQGLTTEHIIYGSIIGLLIAYVTTISLKTKIIFDFKNQIVQRNNRKVRFFDCKKIIIEKERINGIPVGFTVVIQTPNGKMNIPVMFFSNTLEGEQDAQKLARWMISYIHV